ncbi:putative D-lactate dehydrogenase, mitochondrial [Styela clava]
MWQKISLKTYMAATVGVSKSFSSIAQPSKQMFEAFEKIVGSKNISKAPSTLEQHSHDESYHRRKLPDIVVWPANANQVSDLARFCTAERIPMIPYGTGTGLEGGVAPTSGGVCVNLMKMDEIIDVNIEDFDVTVQPGVTRLGLNQRLRDSGMWFPVDPGADASLCGMAATSASGTNAVRYGTMKENILNLQVVLPDGKIIHTAGERRRFKKSAAGYNLTNLFVGSEGTLGFITSATLRLHPVPDSILSAVCAFESVEDAVLCSTNVIQCGIPIARIEFLDTNMIKACNKFSHLSYPVKPSLFLEFHGTEKGAREQVDMTADIVKANKGSNFSWAESQEERNKLWKARHDILYAMIALVPGCKAYSTDVCVPISCLPEAVIFSSELIASSGLTAGIVGHVGDGNFHCLICIDPDSQAEQELVVKITNEIAQKALSMGGTCTGEHGIGLGKKKLLVKEVGDEGINVMRTIKTAFDPLGIMNPGKVL